MDEPDASTIDDSSETTPGISDLPPGDHALEVAARRGIGPLSPSGREVWHGQAMPCVSCGQLILRDSLQCDHCGQDHTPAMLAKMRLHAGPWYVLEHVRPFPGVSLERIIRQIRRGLITETSIVRGPATDNQWRFAAETPGLCRYFERCWRCNKHVSPSDSDCPNCAAHLLFEPPSAPPGSTPRPPLSKQTAAAPPAPVQPTVKLARLSEAVGQTNLPERDDIWDSPPKVAGVRATWIVAALLILVIFVLMWFTRSRGTIAQTSLDIRPAPSAGHVASTRAS